MHTKERSSATRTSYINYCLKSEVSITLHCRLFSTRYTAVQIKNYLKSTSAIRVATMKNSDDFCFEGKPSRATAKSTLFAVNKDEWNTKEETGKSIKNTLYVPIHCMPKGTSQSKATSNSEKIKPVALAIIKLRLSEGISQLLTYSFSQ